MAMLTGNWDNPKYTHSERLKIPKTHYLGPQRYRGTTSIAYPKLLAPKKQ